MTTEKPKQYTYRGNKYRDPLALLRRIHRSGRLPDSESLAVAKDCAMDVGTLEAQSLADAIAARNRILVRSV